MCLSVKVNNPEKVLAEGQHLGFEWVIVHNGAGYRCGYVRVPKGHPWHGKNYNDVAAGVHGGLTFGEPDLPCDKDGPDDAFWFGFDCAHCDDARDPSLPTRNEYPMPIFEHQTVKTQEFVEAECRRLCEQAAAADPLN